MRVKLSRITGALKARHNKAQGGKARESGLWNPGIRDRIEAEPCKGGTECMCRPYRALSSSSFQPRASAALRPPPWAFLWRAFSAPINACELACISIRLQHLILEAGVPPMVQAYAGVLDCLQHRLSFAGIWRCSRPKGIERLGRRLISAVHAFQR